ncbi:MAG: hypothetical protein PVI00_12305 [Desulfobacterales bacterium]|jgi:hypothetical protein
MVSQAEAKIQKEIRRQAFQRAEELRLKRQLNIKTQYTLTALRDVTGLQRRELESIADAVRFSHRSPGDHFFSIKRQILITAGILGSILMLSGLLTLI